jgi:hypothetical protein
MSYSVQEYQEDQARHQRRIALVLQHFPEAMYQSLWKGGVPVFTAYNIVPTDIHAVVFPDYEGYRDMCFFPYQKLHAKDEDEDGEDLEACVYDGTRIPVGVFEAIHTLKEKDPKSYAALVTVCTRQR